MPDDINGWNLPKTIADALREQLNQWMQDQWLARFWERDASLWTGRDEAKWLGWLDIIDTQQSTPTPLREFAKSVQNVGFTDAVVLGMGGSSMCPDVMSRSFGRIAGFPTMRILDSTDPAQIASLESMIDIDRTLFIVASKSGSTLEPNIFMQHFLARVRERSGDAGVRRQFVAVTDPGSQLAALAQQHGFWKTFPGVSTIGGRYSALSNFGLVPAAAMGLDFAKLLERAAHMKARCGADGALEGNPGVLLGAVMGMAHKQGRDKLTIVCSPGIASLGAWLEQLIAESTGKQGQGIIPIDGETLHAPDRYGTDRLFAYLRLNSAPDANQDRALATLAAAGQPVVRLELNDPYDLGAEFFRWEMATAVAGAVIGINPFDQPDVEAAKIEARRLTTEYEASGELPSVSPVIQDEHFYVFTDDRNRQALFADKVPSSVVDALRLHLDRLVTGDYFCLLAFIEMNAQNEQLLQRMRTAVLAKKRVATCVGFGPRFLHSTGQAHKGGPASGVFVQLTCDHARDISVPGQRLSFGIVEAAQAGGDFAVLAERGRRLLRIHLRGEAQTALAALCDAVDRALAPP